MLKKSMSIALFLTICITVAAQAGEEQNKEWVKQFYSNVLNNGNISLIDSLVDQTQSIERVISALTLDGIELEGSDSLDNPNAVFQ